MELTLEDIVRNFDATTDKMEEKLLQYERDLENIKTEFSVQVTEAKNGEILKAIRNLNTRLEAIEARLPPPEED